MISLRAVAAIGITLVLAGTVPALADDTADDVTGPTATITSDVPHLVGKGLQTLAASVTDPAGVDRIEWWADGALRAQGEYLNYDFGTTQRSTVVEVRAWDAIGNQSSTPYPVTVDALAPKLIGVAPAANALVRGTAITATVRLSDQSGVFSVLPLSGTTGIRYTAPFTARVPIPTSGRTTLGWYVTDIWGNATTVHQTVTADNIKPKLTVTKAPANKAKVKGTVVVTAAASDTYGVARVELLVNGRITATDATPGYRFGINTLKYGKTIKIQLRAYDKAGNLTVTPIRTWYR